MFHRHTGILVFFSIYPSSHVGCFCVIMRTVCILSATLLIQDPEFSNGRIRRFNITIEKQKDGIRNGTWEIIPVNRSLTDGSSSKKQITPLKTITLDDEESVTVYVTAINSVGASPQAKLIISRKTWGKCPCWPWIYRRDI